MAKTFGKCVHDDCGEEVTAPNFHCKSGRKHEVVPKTYYKDDAPSDPGARMPGTYQPIGQPLKDSKTLVCNVIPERREQRGHETITIPGVNAEFARGMFTTTDPEMQYWMDVHAERGGCVSKDRWAEVYLTPQQKADIKRMELEAENKRLEKEHSDLLAQVQAARQKQGAGARG